MLTIEKSHDDYRVIIEFGDGCRLQRHFSTSIHKDELTKFISAYQNCQSGSFGGTWYFDAHEDVFITFGGKIYMRLQLHNPSDDNDVEESLLLSSALASELIDRLQKL